MRFISVKMENWLVFRGKQELIFPQDPHANILLIFGENMHGKTSLLNAVRWALYGTSFDRQKREVPNHTLLNIDAASDGETFFNVSLKVNVDDRSYEITRSADVGSSSTNVSLILKEDNRVKDGGVSQSIIDSLVPPQISQFLLFDGELLNQFEQLVVDEGGTQANEIKRNIEKALGLPVLQRAVKELDFLQKSMSKSFQNELRKNRNLENLVRNLERHENDLASKQEEKTSLESDIEETQIRLSELDDILDKANNDIALSERKKLLLSELAKNKREVEDLQASLKLSMGNLWREPLCEALSYHVEEIKTQIQVKSNQRRSVELASSKIQGLEKALVDRSCSECGGELRSDQQENIKRKLETIKLSVSNEDEITEEINLLQKKLNGIMFSNISSSVSLKIRDDSNSKNKLLRRNIEIDDLLFGIRNDLADFDEEKGRKIKTEYKMRSKEVGRLSENILSVEDDIEKIELEINSIKKNPDFRDASTDGVHAIGLERCETLLATFKTAVANYRDTMRKKVGERASDTFGNLTTEKNFDHLEINNSYGLNLIIEGKKVARSAGAEQIVALSLIEALNYHGRRKGPMLMDTPAGRLDKSHRENVMNYLPTVVTQLAFFAHSGELTDSDIYFDRSRIGKKYRIKRQSSFHSLLEEI